MAPLVGMRPISRFVQSSLPSAVFDINLLLHLRSLPRPATCELDAWRDGGVGPRGRWPARACAGVPHSSERCHKSWLDTARGARGDSEPRLPVPPPVDPSSHELFPLIWLGAQKEERQT